MDLAEAGNSGGVEGQDRLDIHTSHPRTSLEGGTRADRIQKGADSMKTEEVAKWEAELERVRPAKK